LYLFWDKCVPLDVVHKQHHRRESLEPRSVEIYREIAVHNTVICFGLVLVFHFYNRSLIKKWRV
jgi:hypothetical protein